MLPQGWVETTIGDCSDTVQYGLTCTSSVAGIGHRYIRITDIQDRSIDWNGVPYADTDTDKAVAYEVAPGDILFARTGATVGKSYLLKEVPHRAAFASYLIRVRTSAETLLPDFAAWFFQSPEYWLQIVAGAEGTGQPNFNGSKLSALRLALPPLAEQRRIVAKLDALTARLSRARAELDRVPMLAERLRKQFLLDAFAGRTRSAQVHVSEWQMLPAIDACAKVQSGGTPKNGFSDAGIPFFKVYNIVDQKIAFSYKPQYVNPTVHETELKKSMAQPGDVLMNIVGPPLGKVAIIGDQFTDCNFNQALTLFRPSSVINSKWLYYFLCSGRSVASVVKETRGIAGQVNISLSQCRAFELPIPPVAEQDRIVGDIEAAFARADHMEAEAVRAHALLDRLEASILARAFRGELVPQDPSDEPASVLLDRILAARAKQPIIKRGRRPAATATV